MAEAGRPLPWKSMAWGESRREGVPPRAAEMTCTYAAKLLLLSAEPSYSCFQESACAAVAHAKRCCVMDMRLTVRMW